MFKTVRALRYVFFLVLQQPGVIFFEKYRTFAILCMVVILLCGFAGIVILKI